MLTWYLLYFMNWRSLLFLGAGVLVLLGGLGTMTEIEDALKRRDFELHGMTTEGDVQSIQSQRLSNHYLYSFDVAFQTAEHKPVLARIRVSDKLFQTARAHSNLHKISVRYLPSDPSASAVLVQEMPKGHPFSFVGIVCATIGCCIGYFTYKSMAD
jgi:hypothetical protein